MKEYEIRAGLGLGGTCICPKCGHEQPHQRNQPCNQVKCPKCGTMMGRKV